MSSDNSSTDKQNRDNAKEGWSEAAEKELNQALDDITDEDQDFIDEQNRDNAKEGRSEAAEKELNQALDDITDEAQPLQVVPPQVQLPDRKKGRFTEEEERLLALGLVNEGKDFDRISKAYVLTRTVEQLKYHYNKYMKNQDQ